MYYPQCSLNRRAGLSMCSISIKSINMTTEDIISAIEQIQKSQSNIKIFTAVPMGIIMILFFFSFATLIDQGMMGALYMEIGSTILFILALIFLNKISFFFVKFLYNSRKLHSSIIANLTPVNINRPAEKLAQELNLK